MLHQTLLTFRPFPSSSSSSYPYTIISPPSAVLSSSSTIISKSAGRPQTCTPTYTVSSQVEMDVMKEMLSSAHEQGLLAEKVYGEGWGSERGNLLAEEFQVDDLLDLRGLPESEEEDEEIPEVAEGSFSTDKPLSASPSEPLELYSEITLHETDGDAASLEWLSRFFDESSTEFPSPPAPPCLSALPPVPIESKHSSARSLSSTATAAGSLSTEALVPIKAKRSKRLRGNGAVWYRSGKLRRPDSSPASSSITTFSTASPSSSSSSSSSSFNSYITYEPSPFSAFILDDNNAAQPNVSKPKKRGRRPKNPLTFPGERRCTHCGVHKTPQWRAGPHGAKTLCNACGVRFKSGRLLPEYRPACSPTFVSHVHSNSHRKVLEMRRKKDEELLLITSAPPVTSC